MNHLKLSGIVNSEPKIDITKTANPVVNLILLDEYKENKNFINITAFKDNAVALKDKNVGDLVYIEGHIQQEKWFSKELDRNISRIIVVADRVNDAIPSERE